jgi:hypothetical protein
LFDLDIYFYKNQQSKLGELWKTRSVFCGEFSKGGGNGGKKVLIFSTVSTTRQFPQLTAMLGCTCLILSVI